VKKLGEGCGGLSGRGVVVGCTCRRGFVRGCVVSTTRCFSLRPSLHEFPMSATFASQQASRQGLAGSCLALAVVVMLGGH
jgi:hypothetical protein